jgi:uncharacterized damage-inducible protein DinB
MSPSKSTSKKSAAPAPKSKAAPKSGRAAAREHDDDEDDDALESAPPARARKSVAPAGPSMPVAPEKTPAKPAKGRGKAPVDLGEALVHAFETNERIHQYLLEQLDPSIWALEAPVGKGRVIRGVFAHIHNVRRLWLTRRGEDHSAPPKVERESATQDELRLALASSAHAVVKLIRDSLANGGHVADFKPDVVGFVAYAIAHEAHHRGQICMLARILGKPLPQNQGYELWNWRKRADEALDARGPSAPAAGAPES